MKEGMKGKESEEGGNAWSFIMMEQWWRKMAKEVKKEGVALPDASRSGWSAPSWH